MHIALPRAEGAGHCGTVGVGVRSLGNGRFRAAPWLGWEHSDEVGLDLLSGDDEEQDTALTAPRRVMSCTALLLGAGREVSVFGDATMCQSALRPEQYTS